MKSLTVIYIILWLIFELNIITINAKGTPVTAFNIVKKNEVQTVLLNFDKVLWDIKKINEKLNTNNLTETNQIQVRQIRSVPRLSRNECSISKDELIAINNEIINSIELNRTITTENKCEFNLSSTQCIELIKIMECGITNLRNQLVDVMSNISVSSSNEIIKWKNAYEKINKINLRFEEDLHKNYDQQYKTQINDLSIDLNILKTSIDKLENNLKEANEHIKQSTIKFCGSEIHSTRIQNCVDDLNDLIKKVPNDNYTEVVIRIIENCYDNYIVNVENMPTINNIIDFIANLKYDLQISAADVLYEKMYQSNYLRSMYVLTFSENINFMSSSVSNKLKIATENIISTFGDTIRHNNNNEYKKEILLYAINHKYIFKKNLKKIIINAYSGDVSNSENIISFIHDSDDIELRASGYHTLYNEIKTKNNFKGHEIIMLVSRIKKIREDSRFSQLPQNEMNYILNIINEVPSGVKALLWDSYIFINSIYNNYKLVELFLLADPIDFSSTQLAICPTNVRSDGDRWTVTEQANGRYYKIRNLDSNSGKEYFWKIKADGESFSLINQKNNVPLYTKDTFGRFVGWWFSLPHNCYEVFYQKFDPPNQGWKIS